MIVALQTARAGSKSVINKNILTLGDKPMYRHAVDKASASKSIDHVYISTDIPEIINSETSKYRVFQRPPELAEDNSSHHDVMIHGINHIEDELNRQIEILIVLLGNSLGSSPQVLDKAIDCLKKNPNTDSVVSVSEFNMFNPFRALKIVDGMLETHISQDQILASKKLSNVNDKNSAGDIYFANGSFFMCRRNVVMSREGNLPFPWLGRKIFPWVEGSSMEIDAPWQVNVLKNMLGRKID
jgi:N-acylneuraminate cytidylyltransferase